MKTLNIDIETYSKIPIASGVYKYIDSTSSELILFAYSFDLEEVKVVDIASGEVIPEEVEQAIFDPEVIKVAFNAQFERACLSRYFFNKYKNEVEDFSFGNMLPANQWRCTMVHALELGLPGSLEKCAEFLGLKEVKDQSGKALINYFSKPCKPTKANAFRERNLPHHDGHKWQQFKDYCKQDVIVEQVISERISFSPVIESEWQLYALDQKINDYGVLIDTDFVSKANKILTEVDGENLKRIKLLTDIENPNSPKQLKEWFAKKGYDMPSLSKGAVDELLRKDNLDSEVKEVLILRKALSNTSNKKYQTMNGIQCSDNRVRGLLQFYGASRTGRWAGRLLQVQNLPRNKIKELDYARSLVLSNQVDELTSTFGDPSETIKQLIRTSLIAKENHTFLVSDFNSIEARVLAWYAGETWAINAFKEHGKIYEATASQMFNVPLDQVDSELRQKGKVATLALGYQGSVGALTKMGAIQMGICEDDLKPLVKAWRKANSNIVRFWNDVQNAVLEAIRTKEHIKLYDKLAFSHIKGVLFIKLPSGRKLAYPRTCIEQGDFGPKIVFRGRNQTTNFSKQDTYGGKLVENIVQATARDLLGEAMLRLDKAGYPIVFHVHDEVVAEVAKGQHSIEEMNTLMSIVPEWAKGLPLSAEGYETDYYKKD